MRTYWKNIRREVKHSFSRFFAIFAIVALGTGFLAGLFATQPDMCETIDSYFDQQKLHDFRLISTLGFSDADIAALQQLDGIDAVMPAYTADLEVLSPENEPLAAKLASIPENADEDNPNWLNRFTLTEGRMPQAEDECVLEVASSYNGVSIQPGDQLTVQNGEDTLSTTTLTVVGLVQSARYFSMEKESTTIGSGYINLYLYLPEDSFTLEAYPEIYLTATDAAAENAFTDDYWAVIDPLMDQLETLADTREALRTDEIRDEAQQKIDDAVSEYNQSKQDADDQLADAASELEDASAEIADGEQQLADGKESYEKGLADYQSGVASYQKQIADAQQELDDAKAQIDQNEQTLADSKKTLEDTQTQLDAQKAELDKQQADLDAKQSELNTQLAAWEQQKAAFDALPEAYQTAEQAQALAAAKAELDAAQTQITQGQTTLNGYYAAWQEGSTQLAAGQAAYEAGVKALADAKAQYEAGVKSLAASKKSGQQKLDDAKADLDAAKETLDSSEQELADAKTQYADGVSEYETQKADADQEFSDAWDEIADAKQELADLEDCKWYLLDRNSCISFVSFDSNAQKIAAIAKVFPIFFFLVAALVIITTMTRMVEEQRGQIGTMQSLGYSNRLILTKYLVYAGSAVLPGCVVGLSIGFVLFPTVIYNAYSMLYRLPELTVSFRWNLALIAAAAAFLCAFGATFSACRATLSEKPAVLMLPKTPKAGKRILLERFTFLWKRMKFTHKVTARNLFRYKKRFFMTVIGIAGCTALLLTGFGLHDSISDIVNRQYGVLYRHDFSVTVSDAAAAEPDSALMQYLDSTPAVSAAYLASQQNGELVEGSKESDLYLFVPQDAAQLSEYLTLQERRSGEAIPFAEDSVVISEKFATTHHISIGDSITLKNADEKRAEFTVTGICENYLYSYAYIAPKLYAEKYGALPEFTYLLGMMDPDAAYDETEISTAILECDDIQSVVFIETSKKTFTDMLTSIDYIVLVLIISAGALAFVVLYNLTNINIAERQKELATIKVLGFKDHEVTAYIYRETVVLTLVGTLFGLIAGIFLHAYVVQTAEVDMLMFGRKIEPLSYLYSTLITLLFSFLVNLLMGRKMKKISMVESMKAND